MLHNAYGMFYWEIDAVLGFICSWLLIWLIGSWGSTLFCALTADSQDRACFWWFYLPLSPLWDLIFFPLNIFETMCWLSGVAGRVGCSFARWVI